MKYTVKTRQTVEDVEGYEVTVDSGGHLIFLDNLARVVIAYAPGIWESIELSK